MYIVQYILSCFCDEVYIVQYIVMCLCYAASFSDHKSDVEKDGKPTFSTQVIFDCLTDDEPKADECYQFPDIIVPKDQVINPKARSEIQASSS